MVPLNEPVAITSYRTDQPGAHPSRYDDDGAASDEAVLHYSGSSLFLRLEPSVTRP